MRRTFMMVGLVALLGCGAEENDSTHSGGTTLTTSPPAADAETVAARVDQFALLPVGRVVTANLTSKVWPRIERPELPEAGETVVGYFDPLQVQVMEATRLRAGASGGVR